MPVTAGVIYLLLKFHGSRVLGSSTELLVIMVKIHRVVSQSCKKLTEPSYMNMIDWIG